MSTSLTLKILGSVSPYSNKNSNCPGYLLKYNKSKILFDCGAGVTKKLKLPDDFEGLQIFISHFHKDHYSDLLTLAYASHVYHNLGLITERIKIYIPKIDKSDYEYIDYKLIKSMKEHFFEIIEYDDKSQFSIEDASITFVKNFHSIKTYSVKVNLANKSFVYAADLGVLSSPQIIKFSEGADILLIESTFLETDNIQNEFHLHAKEAATIAKLAEVKKLVLTHFWPEHSIDDYYNEAKTVFENTICAKENLIINF